MDGAWEDRAVGRDCYGPCVLRGGHRLYNCVAYMIFDTLYQTTASSAVLSRSASVPLLPACPLSPLVFSTLMASSALRTPRKLPNISSILAVDTSRLEPAADALDSDAFGQNAPRLACQPW